MRLLCGIFEDGLSPMVSGNRLCGRRLIYNTHLSPSMMEHLFISQYCGKNANTRPVTCTNKQVVKSCCHEYSLLVQLIIIIALLSCFYDFWYLRSHFELSGCLFSTIRPESSSFWFQFQFQGEKYLLPIG